MEFYVYFDNEAIDYSIESSRMTQTNGMKYSMLVKHCKYQSIDVTTSAVLQSYDK